MRKVDLQTDAPVEEVLRCLETARRAGEILAIPETCVPVLRDAARMVPDTSGDTEACYVFRPVVSSSSPCCGRLVRFCAGLACVVCLPFLLIVSVLILLIDGRPVLFGQWRYGAEGRRFRMFKFRTMVREAADLHDDLKQSSIPDGRLFKLDNDPRVTRLGRLLRMFFLDELPQVWNVAKGEMCFVGPRPLPESDQSHYTQRHHQLRLMGMPGVTGLWQVSGRNERTFDEMCLLDYYYLSHCSWRLDLFIFWRTCIVVWRSGRHRSER